jgi:hypothetical protein
MSASRTLISVGSLGIDVAVELTVLQCPVANVFSYDLRGTVSTLQVNHDGGEGWKLPVAAIAFFILWEMDLLMLECHKQQVVMETYIESILGQRCSGS